MTTINLIILILALSMDTFSGVYLNGFLQEAPVIGRLRAVLYVTVINSLMAGLGFLLGGIVFSLINNFASGIALGILFLLGLKMVIKSFKPKFQEMTYELTSRNILIGFSLALGVNAFLMGIILPIFKLEIMSVMGIFLIVFLVVSILAIIYGRYSNRFLIASRLVLGGGVVISASAVYYLIEHFKFI